MRDVPEQVGITEVAALVGLDADTLRFYERRGVLPAPARDSAGRRRYAPADVETIRRLVALKSTGMSLADIATLTHSATTTLDATQRDTLVRHRAELDAERRRVEASLEFLDHKLATTPAADGTRLLVRPDTTIAYTVQGTGPWLFLVGAPAGRAGFAGLADRLAAHFTVVTHDPRGIAASTVQTPDDPTPPRLAGDLIALIRHLTADPVHLFGTSGGAVTVLDVLTQAPGLVDQALIHEPPLLRLLDDPDLERQARDIFQGARTDPQSALEAWLNLTGAGQSTSPGQVPDQAVTLPPLHADELAKNRYFLGRMAGPTVFYEPDMDALTDRPPAIYAGARSHHQIARRCAAALADRLGIDLQDMPGNHLAASTKPGDVAAVVLQRLATTT